MENTSQPRFNIMTFFTGYTNLDTIFDTRLATYWSIDKDKTERYLKAGYIDRTFEKNRFFKYEEFLECYAKRDVKLLKHAELTLIPEVMSEFCIATMNNYANQSPIPRLMVNIYPYELTVAEQEVLADHITFAFTPGVEIRLLNIPTSDLTPNEVKSLEIVDMWDYDAVSWLDTLAAKGILNDQSCPTVSIYRPSVITGHVTTIDEIASESGGDALDDLSCAVAPFIHLEHYPTGLFGPKVLGRLTNPDGGHAEPGDLASGMDPDFGIIP